MEDWAALSFGFVIVLSVSMDFDNEETAWKLTRFVRGAFQF